MASTVHSLNTRRPAVIDGVVEQHAQEAAHLGGLRLKDVSAPHINLQYLARIDERISAHVDGLLLAGEHGWRQCLALFESADAGALFAATAAALQANHSDRLNHVFALAEVLPDARKGFLAAFGWVSAQQLQKITMALLTSASAFRRYVGITACSMHRIDPGVLLIHAIRSPDAPVRARALRAAGELGRRELLSSCIAAMQDKDPDCSFWGAWSAVLLGDRAEALDALIALSRADGPFAERALRTALLVVELPRAHDLLSEFAHAAGRMRRLVQGCGYAGDPLYVHWLIEQMEVDALARVAGESFAMITGMDLPLHDLQRDPPEATETAPNDDPEASNVAQDDDEDLPWPDARKLADWWKANEPRFTHGVRTFMGAPVTAESCTNALRVGYQRQRRAAALLLALQRPGTALFEWRAPAWRQQRKSGAHA